MKQKQEGVIPVIVVVILAVLVLGGGAVYYLGPMKQLKKEIPPAVSQQSEDSSELSVPTPVTDELVDWQEYNNDRYGYKVKYPAGWYFIKEGYSPPPPATVKLSSISNPYPSAAVELLSMEISVDAALGRTLDNYEEITSLKSQYYKETRLTVGGEPAAKIAVPDPNSSEPISVYIQHKDRIYRIVWGDNTDSFVQNRQLFDKILQSFIFTGN